MKFIHCADIHADSRMDTHFDKNLAEQRRNEIVDTFAEMAAFAKKNDVRAIIISGDFFDTKSSQQKNLKKRIGYIISNHPDTDFLYLRGNHDEDADFLAEEDIPNLKRFSKNEWICYSYGNTCIYGREFAKEIPAAVYSELIPDPEKINIVMLHGQITEYRAKDGAPEISLPRLTNRNIDYIALGHIHDYQEKQLDKRCVWCYSGCLEGRGFDECGKKGFVLLDVDEKSKKIERSFIPIAKRQIHEIDVQLDGTMTQNEIINAIQKTAGGIPKKDIVQVNLTGEISEDTDIETDLYLQTLRSSFFFLRIKDKTEARIDYEKYEKDVSLKGEFIRLVKSQKNIPEEEKTKIIMTGIRALVGRLD